MNDAVLLSTSRYITEVMRKHSHLKALSFSIPVSGTKEPFLADQFIYIFQISWKDRSCTRASDHCNVYWCTMDDTVAQREWARTVELHNDDKCRGKKCLKRIMIRATHQQKENLLEYQKEQNKTHISSRVVTAPNAYRMWTKHQARCKCFGK